MRMIPEKCVVHPWIKDNLKLGISSRKLDKRRLSNYVVKHRWNKALHSVQAVVRMGMAGLKAKPLVRTKTSKDLFSNIQEINTESDLKQSMSMTGINSLDHAKTTNEVVDFRNNVNNEDVSTLRFNSKQFNHKGNTNYTKDGNYDTKRYSSPATENFSNSDNTDTFKRSKLSNKCRHINELEDEFSSSQNLNMLSTRDRSSIIFKLLAGYASKEQPVYSKNWKLERTIKQRATLSSPIETPKFLIKDGRPINSGAVLRIANLFSSNKFS